MIEIVNCTKFSNHELSELFRKFSYTLKDVVIVFKTLHNFSDDEHDYDEGNL